MTITLAVDERRWLPWPMGEALDIVLTEAEAALRDPDGP
jgi:hypothetical protein